MINRKICRRYDPIFCKGHIKDELQQLIYEYQTRCFDDNIMPHANLYMNEITYFGLCEDMKCNMYDRFTGNYGRVFGYNIGIDNRIAPYIFELREEDKMEIDRDSITLNIGGRGCGKIYFSNNINKLPKKYILNQDASILFWEDDTKTVVKLSKDDKNDPVKGFLWAYFLKHSGLSRTKANKYLREIADAYKEAIND